MAGKRLKMAELIERPDIAAYTEAAYAWEHPTDSDRFVFVTQMMFGDWRVQAGDRQGLELPFY